MFTLNTLHSLENGHTVEDILCAYFGVRANKLVDALYEDENYDVEYWADVLKLSFDELVNILKSCLKQPAKFKVVREVGSGGGYPDCDLDLGDGIVLNFSWVTDD